MSRIIACRAWGRWIVWGTLVAGASQILIAPTQAQQKVPNFAPGVSENLPPPNGIPSKDDPTLRTDNDQASTQGNSSKTPVPPRPDNQSRRNIVSTTHSIGLTQRTRTDEFRQSSREEYGERP